MQSNRAQRVSMLVVATLLLGLLAGCGQPKVFVGWMASNRPGHMRACYAAFSGFKVRTVRAAPGETLVVEYGATVNEGTLTFSVEGPDDKLLWVVALDRDSKDSVELPVEQGGRYAIVVRGNGTGGSFAVWWRVE